MATLHSSPTEAPIEVTIDNTLVIETDDTVLSSSISSISVTVSSMHNPPPSLHEHHTLQESSSGVYKPDNHEEGEEEEDESTRLLTSATNANNLSSVSSPTSSSTTTSTTIPPLSLPTVLSSSIPGTIPSATKITTASTPGIFPPPSITPSASSSPPPSTFLSAFLSFFTRRRLLFLLLAVLLWTELLNDETMESFLESTGITLPSWLTWNFLHAHSRTDSLPYEYQKCAAPLPTILPEIYLARAANPDILQPVVPDHCQIYQDTNKVTLLKDDASFLLGTEYLFLLDTTAGPGAAGGTYFEILLSSSRFRTRVPYHDQLDGTYKLSLYVPDFPWLYDDHSYTLEIYLLSTKAAAIRSNVAFEPQRVRSFRLNFFSSSSSSSSFFSFTASAASLPSVSPTTSDIPCNYRLAYARPVWDGYWIKLPLFNETENLALALRTRFGRSILGMLQEWPNLLPQHKHQHWFYRLRHCYFPLHSPPEIRNFYNGKWIMWFGDSNAPDTVRNIADHGCALTKEEINRPLKAFDWRVPFARRHDAIMQAGRNAGLSALHVVQQRNTDNPEMTTTEQTLEPIIYRSMSTFNGAVAELDNHYGGRVYQSMEYKNEVRNQWSKDLYADGFFTPHMVVFNDASLHMRWVIEKNGLSEYKRLIHNEMLPFFQELHDYATMKVRAYEEFMRKSDAEKKEDSTFPSSLQLRTRPRKPRWIYRSTVTPAGPARTLPANPHKIHLLHHLLSGILNPSVQHMATKLPCSYATFPDYTTIYDNNQHPVLDAERDTLTDTTVSEPYWHNVENAIEWSYVDMNDITHAWHYTTEYSDGGHYGREGNTMVDDTWAQILLHWMITEELDDIYMEEDEGHRVR